MLKGLDRLDAKLKKFNKWMPPTSAGKVSVDKAVAQLPKWAKPLLKPSRYKCLFGGRGSGKSYAVADALLILAVATPCRVLCAREYQNSIRDSSHFLLSERIGALGFDSFFDVQRDRIIGNNGSEFLFKGVRHNISSIKSMAGITHCWVEEAQSISAESWRILVPTIREPKSEIWVTFNPAEKTDPVYQEFVIAPDKGAYVRKVNWSDNPYFPAVLNDERLRMQRLDPDAYEHIWEGALWSRSEAQIFNGRWHVEAFEPAEDWNGPYFGADFGFSQDPTTLGKLWVGANTLYIEQESYHVGLDIDKTAAQWQRDIPGHESYEIRADSSRPDTINYLKRHGVPRIIGAVKGKGSIEDGIEFIKSFDRVVIHPQCPKTIEEFRLYRYKVDPKSEKVLPVIVDEFNHVIDNLRYALEPLAKAWRDRNLKNIKKRRTQWRG